MFEDWTDERLRTELCTHAAQLAAGTCQMLLLAAEFESRGTWAAEGCRSAAHWMNWRLGVSLPTAREQLRVGRALGSLPQLRGAFSRGELSYSKARAISRIAIAVPALEAPLVSWAAQMTASQLEGLARDYRRCSGQDAEQAERQRQRRYLRSWTDEEGMVTIRARLSPEEGALVLSAIEAARTNLADQPGSPTVDVSAETPEDQAPGADMAGEAADDVSAETPAAPADDGGPSIPTIYLPDDVDEGEEDYAWPDPAEAPEASELRLDEPLSTYERSQADAFVALCEQFLVDRRSRDADGVSGSEGTVVVVHVDQAVLRDPASPGCCYIQGIGAIAGHVAQRLACEASAAEVAFGPDGDVAPAGRSRQLTRSLRRALLVRDGGCRFPGCGARRFLHAHHVVHWSAGGPTSLSNLVTLCGYHHRLVHEGGFSLCMGKDRSIRVTSPDGVLISKPEAAPAAASARDLWRANASRSLDIDEATTAYGGERFDRVLAIDALLGVSAIA